MVNKLESSEDKIRFVVGMFKFYQPTLTIPEQIALLTLWESSCVKAEEYEMASAIINEITKIQEEPKNVPQRIKTSEFDIGGLELDLNNLEKEPIFIIKKDRDVEELFTKIDKKKSFWVRIKDWFKKLTNN
tara:strand:+ start:12 stop:404 length:393 start_codon:yes stop_codon:yes gene_type:complete